jgi:hypothetical protein
VKEYIFVSLGIGWVIRICNSYFFDIWWRLVATLEITEFCVAFNKTVRNLGTFFTKPVTSNNRMRVTNSGLPWRHQYKCALRLVFDYLSTYPLVNFC